MYTYRFQRREVVADIHWDFLYVFFWERRGVVYFHRYFLLIWFSTAFRVYFLIMLSCIFTFWISNNNGRVKNVVYFFFKVLHKIFVIWHQSLHNKHTVPCSSCCNFTKFLIFKNFVKLQLKKSFFLSLPFLASMDII